MLDKFDPVVSPDCGGTMTTPEGNFASPNWPWPYAHNEHCVWRIYVSQFKVSWLGGKPAVVSRVSG